MVRVEEAIGGLGVSGLLGNGKGCSRCGRKLVGFLRSQAHAPHLHDPDLQVLGISSSIKEVYTRSQRF